MWQYMSSVEPTNMANSSEAGFAKVRASSGGYAFLWDSPVIKYKVGKVLIQLVSFNPLLYVNMFYTANENDFMGYM